MWIHFLGTACILSRESVLSMEWILGLEHFFDSSDQLHSWTSSFWNLDRLFLLQRLVPKFGNGRGLLHSSFVPSIFCTLKYHVQFFSHSLSFQGPSCRFWGVWEGPCLTQVMTHLFAVHVQEKSDGLVQSYSVCGTSPLFLKSCLFWVLSILRFFNGFNNSDI